MKQTIIVPSPICFRYDLPAEAMVWADKLINTGGWSIASSLLVEHINMPDQNLVRHYIQQLEQAMDQAAAKRAVEQVKYLAETIEVLNKWQENDSRGEMPEELVLLLQEVEQKIEPGYRSAIDALAQWARRGQTETWRRQIERLKYPVHAMRKDLRQVEEALHEAQKLLSNEVIKDPNLQRELRAVFQQLDELSSQIRYVSVGGASNERAGAFEEAIKIYQNALHEGYDVIADDVTGEPVEAAKALQRAKRTYWANLENRSAQCYQEAQDGLRDGYPETAIVRLQKANKLLEKVEAGGESLRRRVNRSLAQAREAYRSKQAAHQLVAEVGRTKELAAGYNKLIKARQYYPKYPGLDDLIVTQERLLIDQFLKQVPPLRRRVDTLSRQHHTSLQRSLEEGNTLLSEVQSLQQALKLGGLSSAERRRIKRTEVEVTELVERWRKADDLLQQLAEEWTRVVSYSWDLRLLDDILSQIQATLRGEVEEVTFWEQRYQALNQAIKKLSNLLSAIKEAWPTEDFDLVIEKTHELDSQVAEMRKNLAEDHFTIPENQLKCPDPYNLQRKFVRGVVQVRRRTAEKKDNLQQWEQWRDSFLSSLRQALEQWEQTQNWLDQEPPCRSRSLTTLEALERQVQTLLGQAQVQPPEVWSGWARDIADAFPVKELVTKLTSWLQEMRDKKRQIERELENMTELLAQVQMLMRQRRPLSNRRNQETLRQLVNKMKEIDSCHPAISGYEALLQRLERRIR